MLECASIEEVRDCIDSIDDQNVRLITERVYRAMRWLGELDT